MLLEVRGVTVRYGSFEAVTRASLSVDHGQIVALLGANGAGKTSLARAVSRLIPIAEGEVLFDGRPLTHQSAAAAVRAGIVHVPEGRHVFSDLTVQENLWMGSYTRSGASFRARLEETLDLFPALKSRLKQKAGTLSGGEQQMLALGRALMAEPKLIVLDEPSMGLAPLVIEAVYDTIKSIRSASRSVLLIEQSVKQALAVADRVLVLQTGKVAYEGQTADLRSTSDILEAYL